MSITTLHDALATWEAENQAQRDATQVTPSALGNLCRRNLAYSLNLAPATDDPDTVTVATVGSLAHIGIGRVWLDDPDTVPNDDGGVEHEVPGGGSLDVLQTHPDAADSWVIRDTKTVGRGKFDRWARNDGPTGDVWDQVMTYGRRGGATPAWVMVVDAICRETGRCATYERPFDPEQADDAATRMADMADQLTGIDPDTVPADRDGHGDWFCDSCPWLTRCAGPDGRPNVTELAPDVAADTLAEYVKWNSIANDAQAKAKAARTALGGTTGTFGGWRIDWAVTEDRWVELDEPITSKKIAGRKTIRVQEVKP